MSLLDTAMIGMLTRALDLTVQRQTLVSQNIANIDTPGYHTRDIDFRQELQRVMADDQDVTATPFVRQVPGLIERPDGNNVSIDRESLLMAQNQLQFQTEAEVLHSEFNRLQQAITGGSGQ
jgi:flagellar basal-body rod protein FlgB